MNPITKITDSWVKSRFLELFHFVACWARTITYNQIGSAFIRALPIFRALTGVQMPSPEDRNPVGSNDPLETNTSDPREPIGERQRGIRNEESVASSLYETSPLVPMTDNKTEGDISFSAPAHHDELGRLGKYRILKMLGQGGMGAVYLAFDEKLQRKIALKVMLPKAVTNAVAKDRFLREARAAARLSNDHVVAIYEADEIDGIPYIALQFLEGMPLNDYLKKKGNPPIAQTMRIVRETAEGLAAAHDLGLVHRDIKPANLWLEAPKGRVKILDFGLARQERDDVQLTTSGAVVGTPAYMSPEQARGKTVDHRSDLFSLGVVMYRLLTGKIPFEGENTMAVLMALGTEEPTPVQELNPDVPIALAELTHQLLAKNPDHRVANARSLIERLIAIAASPAAANRSLVPKIEVVPMAISVQTENIWSGIEDEDSATAAMVNDPKAATKPKRAVNDTTSRKLPITRIATLLVGLLTVIAAGFIVIKITNKDGTVTEIKVPDGSKVEVSKNGKPVVTVGPDAKLSTPSAPPPPKQTVPPVTTSILGSVATLPAGKSGLRFEPGSTAIATKVPHRPTTLVTIEAWMTTEAVNLGSGGELIHTPNGSIHTVDDRFRVYTFHGQADTADPIPLGRRIHVAAVNDGKKRYLYLDGKRIAESDDAGIPIPENERVASGEKLTMIAIGSPLFTGTIDAVRVSTTAKYEKEFTPPAEFKKDKDTFALYLFDEGKGDTLKDSSGNGYHAKISGAKWVKGEGAAADDRKTAEWVLSIGGQVEVLAGGKRSTHRVTNPLPSGPLELALVNIAFDQATDENAGRVSGLKRLTHLTFYGGPLSDRGVGQLRDLPQLLNLNLHGTAVTDDCLPLLKQFPQLSELVLMNTKVTHAGLAKLKDIANLTHLYLDETAVDDAGLEHLSQLTGLTRLSLKKTKVTEAGAKKLGGKLPSCLIEYEGGVIQPKSAPATADRAVAEWVTSRKQGDVRVSVAGRETDWLKGAPLPAGEYQLHEVHLSYEDANDESAGRFAGLKHLFRLTLFCGPLTDRGVAKLRDLPNLNYLNLHGTKITNDCLPGLKVLPAIQSLLLIDTLVSDQGLKSLVDLPALEELVIKETAVTDAGLAHLSSLTRLKMVKVQQTKVTETGVKKLAAALPKCKIEWDGGVLEPTSSNR